MIARDPALDSTRAFFSEGYAFIGNRCRRFDADLFETRLMLRRVTCMMGEEAARHFYDGESFTRTGAMPQTTLRLLQDKGSVQSLDGAAHRARKALFLSLLTGDAPDRLADVFEQRWRAAVPHWRARGRIRLHDEMVRLLCDSVCGWLGIRLDSPTLKARADEMAAMIAGAGSIGPRAWRALLLRRRSERWAQDRIANARRGTSPASPLATLAQWCDERGRPLDLRSAGVELLNIIRPTVAIARFIVFAALALRQHGRAAAWLNADPEHRSDAFAQEVRRFYPFFPVIGGRVRHSFSWRDHAFRQGDWVLLGLYATNHDQRLWADPYEFRPERFQQTSDDGFRLVPQGAGDHRTDHRCPGEWITVALIRRALGLLLSTDYDVPAQLLDVPIDRYPTLPRSGFEMVVH